MYHVQMYIDIVCDSVEVLSHTCMAKIKFEILLTNVNKFMLNKSINLWTSRQSELAESVI